MLLSLQYSGLCQISSTQTWPSCVSASNVSLFDFSEWWKWQCMSCACSVQNQFVSDKGRLKQGFVLKLQQKSDYGSSFLQVPHFYLITVHRQMGILELFFILCLENKLFTKSQMFVVLPRNNHLTSSGQKSNLPLAHTQIILLLERRTFISCITELIIMQINKWGAAKFHDAIWKLHK